MNDMISESKIKGGILQQNKKKAFEFELYFIS